MLNYERDLSNTINRKVNRMKCYDSLYFSSNEKFSSLFSGFDFKDKDVFSIVGSGDQALYFYNQGARQVDLYDINIVSIYYYYLRLWCIKYLGDLYPMISISYINNVISKVKPSDSNEENAYNYWKKLINYYEYDYELQSLFFFGSSSLPLYQRIYDVYKLNGIISSKCINYAPIDITKPVNICEKYDIIFVSNLSEYITNTKSFNTYSDNLDNLLKNDGVVIGSNIMYPGPSIIENKVLSKKFDYHNINRGYYYTKKG